MSSHKIADLLSLKNLFDIMKKLRKMQHLYPANIAAKYTTAHFIKQ